MSLDTAYDANRTIFLDHKKADGELRQLRVPDAESGNVDFSFSQNFG